MLQLLDPALINSIFEYTFVQVRVCVFQTPIVMENMIKENHFFGCLILINKLASSLIMQRQN